MCNCSQFIQCCVHAILNADAHYRGRIQRTQIDKIKNKLRTVKTRKNEETKRTDRRKIHRLTSPIFIRYLLTVLRVLLGGGGGPKFLKFWLTFASSPIGSRSSSVAELHFCAPRTQWLGLLPTLTKNIKL